MGEHEGETKNALAFFGILLGFKLWTLLVILVVVTSWDAVTFVVASHVLWIAGAVLLIPGPVIFWIRLVRMRARRARLQRAEWEVEDPRASLR